MATPPITCFKCETVLSSSYHNLESNASCPKCLLTWSCFAISNALIAPSDPEQLPQPRGDDGEASCYNHENNLANGGCSSCGRLLCPVCTLKKEGKTYCPGCWDLGKAGSIYSAAKNRIRYDFGAVAVGAYCFFGSCLSCFMAPGGFLLIVWHFMSPPSIYKNRPAVLLSILAIFLIVIGTAFTSLNVLGEMGNQVNHHH